MEEEEEEEDEMEEEEEEEKDEMEEEEKENEGKAEKEEKEEKEDDEEEKVEEEEKEEEEEEVEEEEEKDAKEELDEEEEEHEEEEEEEEEGVQRWSSAQQPPCLGCRSVLLLGRLYQGEQLLGGGHRALHSTLHQHVVDQLDEVTQHLGLLAGGSLSTSIRTEIGIRLSLNAHTDARRRRRILNVGRVFVLNYNRRCPGGGGGGGGGEGRGGGGGGRGGDWTSVKCLFSITTPPRSRDGRSAHAQSSQP